MFAVFPSKAASLHAATSKPMLPDTPQPVQCTVPLPLPLTPGVTMKNEAKEMTNFFLNIALMHGFRETDEADECIQ